MIGILVMIVVFIVACNVTAIISYRKDRFDGKLFKSYTHLFEGRKYETFDNLKKGLIK